MNLFDFRKLSSFQAGNPRNLDLADPRRRLSEATVRESLLSARDDGSADWRLRWAAFLDYTGAYRESLEQSNVARGIASAVGDTRNFTRALALQCTAEMSVGAAREAKVHLDELCLVVGDSDDPFLRALCKFSRAAYLMSGITGEADEHRRASEQLRSAISLFESCGEYEMEILSRIELAVTLCALGEYLDSMAEIELAMASAVEHQSFLYAGRMLAITASAATDQGYRKGVQATIRRAIEWCQFTGDFWGRIQGEYSLARSMAYTMPIGDPVSAAEPERLFQAAIADAEAQGAIGLAAHISASLAWMYQKSGEIDRKQRLLDQENAGEDRKGHFEGMISNSDAVVRVVSHRIASRLQDGIEGYPDAFFIFDIKRDVGLRCIDFLNEYRNEAGARLLNMRLGAVIMYSETQMVPQMAGLGAALLEATERKVRFEDLCRLEKDGESFLFARRIVPSGDGAVLTIRDVTAEHRIEEALRVAAESAERSDRAKSEFLANMSHEIRTPISGVLGLARMLTDTPLDAVQRAYVDDIIGSGDILVSVIGNILDLSKMESRSMQIDRRPCDVGELVAQTVRLYQGQAREKGLELSVLVDHSFPKTLLTDGPRLKQIVANLVGNAVKFTEAGSIRVVVGVKASEIEISVEDTGIGVPADRLDAIFDRFQQATTDSRMSGGTGLGLTLSRGIARLLGGTITVESEFGAGSRFVVLLPLVECEEIPLRSPLSSSIDFDGRRALLVDDNRVNSMVSRHVLEKLGFEVHLAGNGAEAIERWESGRYDVVLMDIRMPVLDGLEATREIRRREAVRDWRTPIVALTAGALLGERDECFEAGMDDYLSKPFTIDGLREVLARWLPNGVGR